MKEPGLSVLISRSPCPLFERRVMRKKQKIVFQVQADCNLCMRCLQELGCPAFARETSAAGEVCIRINEALCSGCTFCAQMCPSIKPRKIEG